ncbi:MAG: hypothetical protein EXS25_02905 [Pedosphaera sp.]|nr:hypothetical protein [Pedosphaera sp.]
MAFLRFIFFLFLIAPQMIAQGLRSVTRRTTTVTLGVHAATFFTSAGVPLTPMVQPNNLPSALGNLNSPLASSVQPFTQSPRLVGNELSKKSTKTLPSNVPGLTSKKRTEKSGFIVR